eukprot:gene19056-22784_t
MQLPCGRLADRELYDLPPGVRLHHNNEMFQVSLQKAREATWENTFEFYRDSARSSPGNAVTQRKLVDAALKVGKVDEAVAAGRAAVVGDSAGAESHFALGVALQTRAAAQRSRKGDAAGRLDDLGAAATAFRECLRLEPSHVGAHTNQLVVLEHLGLLDELHK